MSVDVQNSMYWKVNIINNTFYNNIIKGSGITVIFNAEDISNSYACYLYCSFDIFCSSNNFVKNHGNLMHFSNIPSLEITKSFFYNNTVDSYIISYEQLYNLHLECGNVLASDTVFSENRLVPLNTANNGALFYIHGKCRFTAPANISFVDVIFQSNLATPVSVSVDLIMFISRLPPYILATFKGKVVFDNNSGITGGGLYINDNVTLYIASDATLSFTNNNAIYGGAIYVGSSQTVTFGRGCFIQGADSMLIKNNTALIGCDIYSEKNSCISCHQNLNITSPPTILSGTSVTVFPGETITLNMTVTDCYGKNAGCEADVLLTCGSGTCTEYGIQLEGSSTTFLTSGLINSGLHITSATDQAPLNTSLLFICKTHKHFYIEQTHLGYNYNLSSWSCPQVTKMCM